MLNSPLDPRLERANFDVGPASAKMVNRKFTITQNAKQKTCFKNQEHVNGYELYVGSHKPYFWSLVPFPNPITINMTEFFHFIHTMIMVKSSHRQPLLL